MHITHVYCVILLGVLYTIYWWVYLVAYDFAHQYVKELYGLGLRRIGVFSAPPLGCLLSHKALNEYSGKGCANYLNEASKSFNAKLLLRWVTLTTICLMQGWFILISTTLYLKLSKILRNMVIYLSSLYFSKSLLYSNLTFLKISN